MCFNVLLMIIVIPDNWQFVVSHPNEFQYYVRVYHIVKMTYSPMMFAALTSENIVAFCQILACYCRPLRMGMLSSL